MKVNLYFYSAILLLEHLAFALSVSTLGPTYVDLKYVLNTSIQNISQIPVYISVGNILGTLFGLLFKYASRQLIVIVLMIMMAIASTLIPFSTELWHLYTCSFVFGVGTGVWCAAFYTWIIEIWQQRSAQVLFLAQFLYGLGFVLGPLLASPFVTGGVESDGISNETLHAIVSVSERRSKLIVPFVVSGGFQAICPILLFFMFVVKSYEKPDKELETAKSSSDSGKCPKLSYQTLLIVPMTLCLACINTLEIVYFNLGSTYLQYNAIKLTASKSASIISSMTATYTIGQAMNFFIAMIVKTEHIIAYHFVLSFATLVSLIFAQSSEPGLWVVNALIGVSISGLFAGHMTYFERFVAISDRISTFMWCSIGAINFIPPIIFGHFIEQFPSIFIVIEITLLTVSLISLFMFVLMKNKID